MTLQASLFIETAHMGPNRLFLILLLFPAVHSEERLVDHGGPELKVDGPVLAPIQHKKYFVDEREQFGYNPRFVPGPVSFGPDNRPYIWLGRTLITLNEDGRWYELDVSKAVREKYDDVLHGVTVLDPHLCFDADGDAYLIVRAGFLRRANLFRETPTRREEGFGLLHSRDGCLTWEFYETVSPAIYSTPFNRKLYTGAERIEKYEAHNQTIGPPPMVEGRGRELAIFIATKKPDGTLNPPKPILVADARPPVVGKGRNWITPAHSGCGNVTATFGGKTHLVWLSIQPYEWHKEEVDKLPSEMEGEYTPYGRRYKDGLGALAPCYVRTFDHKTGKLGKRSLLGFTRRDNHNGPVISVDSKGNLHVVIGAHHDNFMYTRSLKPNSSEDGWTPPRMFGTPNPPKGAGSYTYQAMVVDPDDTLHLVSRWAGSGYYFRLVYQRKKAGQDWEPHKELVIPFRWGYSVWYHKLNIDRLGRLFLNYVYYPAELKADEKEAYNKKYPEDKGAIRSHGACILVSDDGGDSWRLAVTSDFVKGMKKGDKNDE